MTTHGETGSTSRSRRRRRRSGPRAGPLDWQSDDYTSLQPDLLVARDEDEFLKRAVYEKHQVPSYWVVDPAEPSVVTSELEDGKYVEVGRAIGDTRLGLRRPFPVSIKPSALLRE
jgi:Uma2 family endonuclease